MAAVVEICAEKVNTSHLDKTLGHLLLLLAVIACQGEDIDLKQIARTVEIGIAV